MLVSQELTALKNFWSTRNEAMKKDSAARAIGYMSLSTPVEIIYAAGLRPVRLMPAQGSGEHVDSLLQRVVCSYIRGCLDDTLAGQHSYLEGMAQVHTCDNQTKTFDVFRYNVPLKFYYFLNAPHVVGPSGLKYFVTELKGFIRALEEYTGGAISDDSIRQAIAGYNEGRRLMRQLGQFAAENTPVLKGSELALAYLCGLYMDKQEHNRLLGVLLKNLPSGGCGGGEKKVGVRVHLSGTVYNNLPLIKMLEDCGLAVVSNDTSIGARAYWHLIDEQGDDPIADIARHYLGQTYDPYHYTEPQEVRFEFSLDLIRRSGAQAVVAYYHDYCDAEKINSMFYRRRLQDEGIPLLLLEGEYSTSGNAQFRTRVQSFVEMLGGGGR